MVETTEAAMHRLAAEVVGASFLDGAAFRRASEARIRRSVPGAVLTLVELVLQRRNVRFPKHPYVVLTQNDLVLSLAPQAVSLASHDNDGAGDGRITDMGSPGWLDRYIAGKRAEVWHELRQLGAEVREPDATEEAQAVCDQMTMRARQNIETIVARLTEQGYRFHTNDDEQRPIVPHYPPSPDAPELAAWFQVHFGRVPLTLLSWVRLVGDVWLVGTHPLWTASASADPLVIEVEGTRYPGESMRDYFEDEHQAH